MTASQSRIPSECLVTTPPASEPHLLRPDRTAGLLRPDRAVEGLQVPAAQRDLLHVQPGMRGVDEHAAAHVDADMPRAVEHQDVAGLKG